MAGEQEGRKATRLVPVVLTREGVAARTGDPLGSTHQGLHNSLRGAPQTVTSEHKSSKSPQIRLNSISAVLAEYST